MLNMETLFLFYSKKIKCPLKSSEQDIKKVVFSFFCKCIKKCKQRKVIEPKTKKRELATFFRVFLKASHIFNPFFFYLFLSETFISFFLDHRKKKHFFYSIMVTSMLMYWNTCGLFSSLLNWLAI